MSDDHIVRCSEQRTGRKVDNVHCRAHHTEQSGHVHGASSERQRWCLVEGRLFERVRGSAWAFGTVEGERTLAGQRGDERRQRAHTLLGSRDGRDQLRRLLRANVAIFALDDDVVSRVFTWRLGGGNDLQVARGRAQRGWRDHR